MEIDSTSIVVLADDMTGTLDTGVQFAQQGVDCISFPTETSFAGNSDWNHKVYVVNTNSRHLPFQEAYAKLFNLASFIKDHGIRFVFKKTDSALRGNIGAELSALMDAYHVHRLVFAPSYPDMERYTLGGVHYYGDIPIAKTVFGKDPFNPVRHSHVDRIIRETSTACVKSLGVGEKPYKPAKPTIFIMDAEENGQLKAICTEAMELGEPVLLAGCAGLAKALADIIGDGEMKSVRVPEVNAVLVISGSLNQITIQQIMYLSFADYPVRLLHSDIELKKGYERTDAFVRLVDDVCRQLETKHVAILATAGLDNEADRSLADPEKDEVAQTLTNIAGRILCRTRDCALVILGGDTLLSVVTNLFQGEILPITELMPGFPLSLAHYNDGRECLIATRSGGFGTEDSLEIVLQYFRQMGGANMNQMKGIVKEHPKAGAVYRTDLPIPEVGDNDVLVKVRAAAICGTDLHIYHWNDWAQARVPVPMVFGHEFSGDIVKTGKNVTAYQPGDRIAAETHIPCNHCIQCKTGNMHNCESMKILGVHVPGGFSDYAVIPQDCVWKLDDAISYRHGAMLEPMGVAVHGVMSGETAMRSVVILGCGPIGAMAVGSAKAAGAAFVVAADIFDAKLEMAQKVGADVCVNTRKKDLITTVLELTGGCGADVIIDYTGNVELIEDAFRCLKKGGRFTMVGLPNKKLSLDLTTAVIYKEARINGVTGRKMYETWYQCTEILKKKIFTLDDIIGGEYGMADFEQAFSAIAAGKPGKMLLIPDGEAHKG